MSFCENITHFCGKEVADFKKDSSIDIEKALRIRVDWEAYDKGITGVDLFHAALEDPKINELTSLIFGDWGGTGEGNDSSDIIEAFVNAKEKLPNIKHIFIGEMQMEESEISWIEQSDLSSIWSAYPNLEHLQIRGGNSLTLGSMVLPKLKTLIIETGGLDASVVDEIKKGDTPNLEHLELWLGDENYGANTDVQDFKSILDGSVFPKLSYLGLRNSEITDDLAKAFIGAPVLSRLNVLDLSMGTLSDEGAQALLDNSELHKLDKLDLHHHYMTTLMMEKISNAFICADVDSQNEDDIDDDEAYRYVAVSE